MLKTILSKKKTTTFECVNYVKTFPNKSNELNNILMAIGLRDNIMQIR